MLWFPCSIYKPVGNPTLSFPLKPHHKLQEDKEKLKLLQLQISCTEDLRCLFVLLLRCYNPNIQSRQYLQDLIVTNHTLLLLLDGVRELTADGNPGDMLGHIKQ